MGEQGDPPVAEPAHAPSRERRYDGYINSCTLRAPPSLRTCASVEDKLADRVLYSTLDSALHLVRIWRRSVLKDIGDMTGYGGYGYGGIQRDTDTQWDKAGYKAGYG